jgi:serine/threonine-protein kinase
MPGAIRPRVRPAEAVDPRVAIRQAVAVPKRRAASQHAKNRGREIIGRVIGDKYGVTGLIGEGGMGAVYEAEHLAIGRLVAVKVLHPRNAQKRDAISRLQHEARVVGTIGHPNICEIYDMGRLEDGSPYLVMERLQGETLAQRIDRDGPVPYLELIDMVIQVLSALIAAHEKGVIHRDLKPDNIFLTERSGMPSVAKLLDFGISKASGIEDTAVNLTKSGMVMGTPYYMAPEQARGERMLDHRVDLWAVGVILYEALTGRRPFVAKNYNALLVHILTSRHRPLADLAPHLPAPLGAVVDRALSKMREDRFQSAAEFQETLLRMKRTANPLTVRILAPDSGSEDPTVVLRIEAEPAAVSESTPGDDTPVYPASAQGEEYDPEATIVDPPRFWEEGVTVVDPATPVEPGPSSTSPETPRGRRRR